MEERNRNMLKNPERRTLRDVPDEVPTQRIINFESGRKALEKARLEEAKLLDRSPLQGRLPKDWLEFLLRIALFFALLLGLYGALIGRF
jgi:hypothetical protein